MSLPRAVWAGLAAGVAFRVWKAFVDPSLVEPPVPGDFQLIAKSLVEVGVYSYDGVAPTAFRLPLWPLTLALFFKLAGSTTAHAPIVFLNVCLSLGTGLLAYRAARRLAPEPWAAAATWLCVLNPFSAHLDFSWGYETVLTFLFAALMLLLVRAVQDGSGSPRPWLAVGAVTGLSLTCRSSMLFLPPLLTVLMPSLTGRRGSWRHGVLMTALAYAFVVPWLARNYAVFGRVIPFEDGMGLHALYQSTQGVQGIMPDEALPEPIRTYYFARDPAIGPASRDIALRTIREAPFRYIGLCLRRVRTLWFDGGWAEQGLKLDRSFADYRAEGSWGRAGAKAGVKGLEAMFLLFVLVGMAFSWRDPAARTVTLLILYMNIHLLTQGLSRYVVPAIPALAVLAAVGARGAWSRIKPGGA